MRLSAIPIGNEFKYCDIEYVKASHNRGRTVVNGKIVYRTFKKHTDVEVEKIIYKGDLKNVSNK